MMNHLEVLQRLIVGGADVDHCCTNGYSPMLQVGARRDDAIAGLALGACACVHKRAGCTCFRSTTPVPVNLTHQSLRLPAVGGCPPPPPLPPLLLLLLLGPRRRPASTW